MELALAIALAVAFGLTNGLHDAANAVATIVATRGARPAQAIVVSAAFNLLGAVIVGAAVANTIAGIATVPDHDLVAVTGAAMFAATAWNVVTWAAGLPSSSGHALVGGLVGAALAASGSVGWGGMRGIHPAGVAGVLIALAASPLLGLALGFAVLRVSRLVLRGATRRIGGPLRAGEWLMTAALSFSHGANDGQKSMGVIAAMLVATGHLGQFSVPLWIKLVCGGALTIGTALGGWRIVRTVGRGITRLSSLDAFASQASSAAVVLGMSLIGGPVSSTQVVASSIVGVGGGARRWSHVRWAVVRWIALSWVLTMPACGVIAAITLVAWRTVA